MKAMKLKLPLMIVLWLPAMGQSPIVSVCEVLQRPVEFDSSLVMIRGELITGMETVFLGAKDCGLSARDSLTDLTQGIWLSHAGGPLAPNSPVKADSSSIRRATDLVHAGAAAAPTRVYITAYGQLETKVHKMGPSFVGYGHLGRFRAQFAMVRVAAVEFMLVDTSASEKKREEGIR